MNQPGRSPRRTTARLTAITLALIATGTGTALASTPKLAAHLHPIGHPDAGQAATIALGASLPHGDNLTGATLVFGDKSQPAKFKGSKLPKTVHHVYGKAGTYRATLTVADGEHTATTATTITIASPASLGDGSATTGTTSTTVAPITAATPPIVPATPVPAPGNTSGGSGGVAPIPTPSPTPTATPTATPTPTASPTPTSSSSPTSSAPAPTATVSPTSTSSPAPTSPPTPITIPSVRPGTLSVVAGLCHGPLSGAATSLCVNQEDDHAVVVDTLGNVYFADPEMSVVEKVTPAGVLSVVAGNGRMGFPVAGPATSSEQCSEPVDRPGGAYLPGDLVSHRARPASEALVGKARPC